MRSKMAQKKKTKQQQQQQQHRLNTERNTIRDYERQSIRKTKPQTLTRGRENLLHQKEPESQTQHRLLSVSLQVLSLNCVHPGSHIEE